MLQRPLESKKADGLYIPRAIAVRWGRVLVDNGNNTISELNASNGSLVRIVNVKLDPKGLNSADGIAVSGPYIVVLNIYSGQKGSVTAINARNGRMVCVIQKEGNVAPLIPQAGGGTQLS